MPLCVRVERLRRQVGFIWPDNRAGLEVCAEPAEVFEVAEGLEDPAVVEQVRKIDVGSQAILKSDMDRIAL